MTHFFSPSLDFFEAKYQEFLHFYRPNLKGNNEFFKRFGGLLSYAGGCHYTGIFWYTVSFAFSRFK
tara:strand:+ start:154 stop:351 length:198 start_codon:yes stop_codon:yes gene_type:complete